MRRVSQFFTPKRKSILSEAWPWALGFIAGCMYLYNHEPFDDVLAAVVTQMRRPLIRGTEWLEAHDLDPDVLVLELPPEQLFGPLPFPQQMKFLLAALRADNELADNYLTRLTVDYMDLSLDPPLLDEAEMLNNGAYELIDFAVADFTDNRPDRKFKFCYPDQFVRIMNWIAVYPALGKYFVEKHDGVRLMLEANAAAKNVYARLLVMRVLTLCAFTQPVDGEVERRLMLNNGMKIILDCYLQSSGDPIDTRYITLPLSSLLRHFPQEAGREFIRLNGIQAIVNNLNIARYKGIPQHIRLIHDVMNLPQNVINKDEVAKALFESDLIPVAIGIIDAFPEYVEASTELLSLLKLMLPYTTPKELLEYRFLTASARQYIRYKEEPEVLAGENFELISQIVELIERDPDCQRCLHPSVIPGDLDSFYRTVKTMKQALRALKSKEIAEAAAANEKLATATNNDRQAAAA